MLGWTFPACGLAWDEDAVNNLADALTRGSRSRPPRSRARLGELLLDVNDGALRSRAEKMDPWRRELLAAWAYGLLDGRDYYFSPGRIAPVESLPQLLGWSDDDLKPVLSSTNGSPPPETWLPENLQHELAQRTQVTSGNITEALDDVSGEYPAEEIVQAGIAEEPYDLYDAAERILAMDACDAALLCAWTHGWWDGLGAAEARLSN